MEQDIVKPETGIYLLRGLYGAMAKSMDSGAQILGLNLNFAI